MNNVVSFSGGRTSAYLIHLMENKLKSGEIDNVHYVFMDTGAEHPKTYDFIRQVVNHFQIKLTCLRVVFTELGQGNKYEIIGLDEIGDDLKPFYEMSKKYGLPYLHGAFCTQQMKERPYLKWCKDNFDEYTTWLGIRIDESGRIKPKKNTRYMAEISIMDKIDVIGWWRQQPFDLDLDSDYEGNCVFCIKKGISRIALAARKNPDLASKFIKMVDADDIRVREQKEDYKSMYRGNHSLKSIIESYEQFSEDQIRSSIRTTTGACTESCEVFNCQVDMFEDDKDAS